MRAALQPAAQPQRAAAGAEQHDRGGDPDRERPVLRGHDQDQEQQREREPYLQAEQHDERHDRQRGEVESLLAQLGAEDLQARARCRERAVGEDGPVRTSEFWQLADDEFQCVHGDP